MKIIIVGATGTIGRAVAKEIGKRHHIINAAHHHGDIQVDITDPASIEKMYKKIGEFHAVIATAGSIHFAELSAMTQENYQLGLQDKLMGQVNLVLIGLQFIHDKGSFTLTSGILNHDPIRYGSSASMVNGAIDGFVKGAAIEMPRQIRINAVSPSIIAESMNTYGDYFHGFEPVPASRVALAYSKSVEGLQTGKIYHVC